MSTLKPEIQNMLSIKRNRNKTTQMCNKCQKVFDNDILTFTSITEIMNFIKTNILPSYSEYITNEILINDKQKDINVKLCKKCFYKILFNKGINYFYSDEVNIRKEEHGSKCKSKWNAHVENVYRSCFHNLKEYVDVVKSSLDKDWNKHECLMKKIFLHYFFGKNQQLFNKYNDDMEKCKNQMKINMEIVKDMSEKNKEYGGNDKKVKGISEKKLKQILMIIKSFGNIPLFTKSIFPFSMNYNEDRYKSIKINNVETKGKLYNGNNVCNDNKLHIEHYSMNVSDKNVDDNKFLNVDNFDIQKRKEDKRKNIHSFNLNKWNDNLLRSKLPTTLIPPLPLLPPHLLFMQHSFSRNNSPDIQMKPLKLLPPPPLPQGLINNPFLLMGIPPNLDLHNLIMKNTLSPHNTFLPPPKLFDNINQSSPFNKFNPLPFPNIQNKLQTPNNPNTPPK